MNRNYFYPVSFFIVLLTVISCQKEENLNTEITVASLSGTYGLTALTWTYGGTTYNIYDSLDACDRDNLTKLNTDMSLNFIDAGIVCSPPTDDNGEWSLSGDSLYFDNLAVKIESFDGTTLVLSGHPVNEPLVSAVTTLRKQ
jgi:hypothetical protein